MVKYTLLFLIFFISLGYCDLVSVEGNINCDNSTIRDAVYNWVVARDTSTWKGEPIIIAKSNYEAVGSTPAYYTVFVKVRIKDNVMKNIIKEYVRNIKLNSHIVSMRIVIHKCGHDNNSCCTEQENVYK